MNAVPLLAQALMAAGNGVILLLGSAHLLFTYHGPKLLPREAGVRECMEQATIVITRETTLWKVWIGFNASHSLGLISFSLIYLYLTFAAPEFLFRSGFLLALGFAVLLGYVLMARGYWFSGPFAGATFALGCYVAALTATTWA